MKAYACTECNNVWFESHNNKKKHGWGCPNGCTTTPREVYQEMPHFIIESFDVMLKKETKDDEKKKIRHHLNLLRKIDKYPFE